MNRKATILIPTHDNKGNALPHLREKALARLIKSFGAVTTGQHDLGWWTGPNGKVISDIVVPAFVTYEAGPHRDETVKEIAQMIAFDADQVCVYVEFATIEAVLIPQVVEAHNEAAMRAA